MLNYKHNYIDCQTIVRLKLSDPMPDLIRHPNEEGWLDTGSVGMEVKKANYRLPYRGIGQVSPAGT
jgi:hypothetical protein